MSFVTEENKADLACTYAALILNDSNTPITTENIAALLAAANVEVEAYYPKLFANVLEGRNINDVLFGAGASSSGSDSSSGSSSSGSSSDSSSDSD